MKDIHGGDWAGYQNEYGKEPLDFSMSVSMLGIPEKAAVAAKAALEGPAKYPDPLSRRLRERLSERFGIPAEQIVCGTGAADIIWRLVQAVRPKKALIPVPTFTEYARALESCGCEIRTWDLAADGFALTEDITEKITDDTDILFLCEPNNPTGKRADPAVTRAIQKRCRETGCLLVVDECFMEFTEEPERYTAAACLRNAAGSETDSPEAARLVVLRAFTKTFAMAGLRLGYALCGSRELAEQIRETGQPWPVSAAAEAAGAAALEETAYLPELRRKTAEGRRFLERELRECGCTVVSGEANFVLFRCDGIRLAEELKEKGILIRDCSGMEGLGTGWFRAAVRGKTDNEELIRQIRVCCGMGSPEDRESAEI